VSQPLTWLDLARPARNTPLQRSTAVRADRQPTPQATDLDTRTCFLGTDAAFHGTGMGLLVTAPPVLGIDCMCVGACPGADTDPGADPCPIFALLVPAVAAAAAAAAVLTIVQQIVLLLHVS